MADWLTVTAYLVTAALSGHAASCAWLRRAKRDRLFWKIVTGLLVFLAVNELLDLQTVLTMAGRAHAKASGWYGVHREVQYVFVLGLTVLAAIAGLTMFWLTRSADFAVRLALVGLVFIGLFVLLRAASFHHLDDLLGSGAPEFNWGSIQEMAGISIVAYAALRYSRKRGYG